MDSLNPNLLDHEVSKTSSSIDVGVNRRGSGIAGFAVRYPVTVSMILIAIILLGWISLRKLPINLFPDLRAPRITVMADAPGLAPQEIERIVIEPIEGRLSTIKGVEQVSSISRADSGAIIIDFLWGTDMDFALLEVKKNVQGANIEEIESITTLRYDPNALPVMTLGLYGNRSMEELRHLAERTISPALERVEGVARAEVTGGLIPEMHCMLNPELLHFYRLTIDQVAQALNQANVSASGGWVEEGNQRYMIRAVGELKKIEEVSRAVVGYSNGVPIYITDLGEVKWSVEEPINAVHMDGKSAVGIALYKEAGSNTVEVVKAVRTFLGKDRPAQSSQIATSNPSGGTTQNVGNVDSEANIIPKDCQIEVAYDQSLFITKSIDEVRESALEGMVLAIIVLIFFLREFRSTFIVTLVFPISLLATFNLMYFTNLSLNIMTLGGLALSVGNLVDNAIVIIENIFRRRLMGDNPHAAAMNGSGEVAMAIVASTFTSVVVFIPIAYMGGVTAQLFKEQALTVVIAQVTSLMIALIMMPAFCSRFLKSIPKPEKEKQGIYTRLLQLALDHKFVTCVAAILMFLSCVPFVFKIKQEFIPQSAETQFIVKAHLPAGTRLESTERAAKNLEGWLSQDMGNSIEHIFTRIGPKPEDTGAIEEEPEGSNTAEILVTLKDKAPMNAPQIIEYLEAQAKKIQNLEMSYLMSQTSLSSLIGGSKAALLIELKGPNLDTLTALAREVKNRLEQTPEIANIRTSILDGNPEVHLVPDRTLMMEAGLDQQKLVAMLQSQLRGKVATSMQDVDQTKDIRVQLGNGKLNLPELLSTIIPLGGGRVVTLENIVTMKVEPGPREILHRNKERIARVLADVAKGRKLSESVAAARETIGEMRIPDLYSVRFGGEEENRRESFERLRFALILALVLVYMVMASLFESLLHPFIIMFSLPLAAVGVIWGFYLTGQTMNLMGYIGIIMLAGIVVNNAIVLIDCVNQLYREEGMNLKEAVVRAGGRRLRPIMMTTLTTILGMFPLALGMGEGAKIQAPMAIAVIGGMISSTILTLIIIPVLYYMAEKTIAGIKEFFVKFRGQKPEYIEPKLEVES